MTKKEWVQQLRIGEIVRDCKGVPQRIMEIYGQGYDNPYEVQVVLKDDS